MGRHSLITIVPLSAIVLLGLSLPPRAEGRDGYNEESSQYQIIDCVRQRAWMAYFQDDRGRIAPVRDTLNTENDEDWLGLRFTEFDGPRLRLGVLKVINNSPESEEWGRVKKIEVPVAGIRELLTVALYNTKRFDIIEQRRVEEVEAQQERTDLSEMNPASVASIGKVLGAQYLIYGTVNEWNPSRSIQSSGGVSSATRKEAEIAITFTLTEVRTGKIQFITTERAKIGEWSLGKSAVGAGLQQNTPVSYAVRACINKATFKLAAFLKNRKLKASVVDIKRTGIYINAGSEQGVTPLAKLSVQAVIGIIRDPVDWTVLGEDLRGIGTLEVISVQSSFSIALVIEGCNEIKIGDRVEFATAPIPPQISAKCAALDVSHNL